MRTKCIYVFQEIAPSYSIQVMVPVTATDSILCEIITESLYVKFCMLSLNM